jgi:hypothetical protein
MNDLFLLMFGTGVSFVFAAGCYLYQRQSFVAKDADQVTVDALEHVDVMILKPQSQVVAQ